MPLDRARFEEFHIKVVDHIIAIREVAMEMKVPFMFLASIAIGSVDKDGDGRDMAELLFCENNHEDFMENEVQRGVMIELMLSMMEDPKLAEELMKIQIIKNIEPMAERAQNDEEWR